jgi:hypothetical protein
MFSWVVNEMFLDIEPGVGFGYAVFEQPFIVQHLRLQLVLGLVLFEREEEF